LVFLYRLYLSISSKVFTTAPFAKEEFTTMIK
jgi:hypothetical protein